MNRENLLKDFVAIVLNDNLTRDNACLYSEDFYLHGKTEKVTFNRNHREQYNKLLAFCIENNLTIISTLPATLATIVRIDYIDYKEA